MIKKIKILWIFVFFIIVFSYIFSLSLNAQNIATLNYYSLKAAGENQIKTMTIAIPLKNKNPEYLEAKLKNDFFTENRGSKINSNRLSILTVKERYPLDTKNKKIFIEENLVNNNDEKKIVLQISLLVEPEDPPGIYHNELIISQKNSQGKINEIKFPIQFKIEPWADFKINTDFYEISQINFENRDLESIIPGEIEIRGNASWRLYVSGYENEIISNKKLELRTTSRNDYIEIHNKSLNIGEEKVLLASGDLQNNNFNESFIINFDMVINDFQELKAGRYKFPIKFQFEILNFN
ncbi:MAG: hypothetical protein ACQEQD_08980 [Bacillota bacterium]